MKRNPIRSGAERHIAEIDRRTDAVERVTLEDELRIRIDQIGSGVGAAEQQSARNTGTRIRENPPAQRTAEAVENAIVADGAVIEKDGEAGQRLRLGQRKIVGGQFAGDQRVVLEILIDDRLIPDRTT